MTSAKPKKKISCRFSCLFLNFLKLTQCWVFTIASWNSEVSHLKWGIKIKNFSPQCISSKYFICFCHQGESIENYISIWIWNDSMAFSGSSPILTNFSTKTASPDLTISCFHFLLISVPDSDFSVTMPEVNNVEKSTWLEMKMKRSMKLFDLFNPHWKVNNLPKTAGLMIFFTLSSSNFQTKHTLSTVWSIGISFFFFACIIIDIVESKWIFLKSIKWLCSLGPCVSITPQPNGHMKGSAWHMMKWAMTWSLKPF